MAIPIKTDKNLFIFTGFSVYQKAVKSLLKSSTEREENMTFISAPNPDKIFSFLLFAALPNTCGHLLGFFSNIPELVEREVSYLEPKRVQLLN